MAVAPPHGVLEFATTANRSRLSRRATSGAAQRLASGIYAIGATLAPEQVVQHHLQSIIAHVWPSAVLCGRTAVAGGLPADGVLFVAGTESGRRTRLALPGVAIVPVVGPGPVPGDIEMPHGLWLSGPARLLVENLDLRGRPALFRAGTTAVEDRIDDLARSGGAGRIQSVLAQLDVIAGYFDPFAVSVVRSRLTALLGSFDGAPAPASEKLRARLAETPYDQRRIDMLRNVVTYLADQAPQARPITGHPDRWAWLPFFEAYFSNFIEGTEFGPEEARRIAIEGVVPADRPKDAHDVTATFRLACDRQDRTRVPTSSPELIGLLRQRHSMLMGARPEKHPGALKEVDNFAGGYRFVEWQLVEGTLSKGFDVINAVVDPLHRATAMMLLITECHPFLDGNGRVARLAANAELTVAGQVRLIIPTAFRNNYLAALNAISNGNGRGEQLLAVLAWAQRWTAAVPWRSFDEADAALVECNAYLDPGLAEEFGRRVRMPDAD